MASTASRPLLAAMLAWAAAAAAPPQTPEQLHLTLHSDPDQLVATWTSWETAPAPAASVVAYGPTPDQLGSYAVGRAFAYESDLCPSNSSRSMHVVEFPAPRGAPTFYRVSADNATWSPVFRTAAPAPAADGSLTLAVFGDLGVNCDVSSVPALVNDTAEGLHQLIVHYGDTVRGSGVDRGARRAVQGRAPQRRRAAGLHDTPRSGARGAVLSAPPSPAGVQHGAVLCCG
jgi:hypothetical protein